MNALKAAFQKTQSAGYGALIGYIMAGDPDPEITPKIADALIQGGIDILELGLPFSDPIADGPTIQAAGIRALESGTTPMLVLDIAKKIKRKHDVPIVVMTYFNPLFCIGLEKLMTAAKEHEVDGLIVPDLPVEEAGDYRKAAATHDLDTVFLAAPSTSNKRISEIVDACSGFLYLVSHFGVTGAQGALEQSTIDLIKRVKPFTQNRIPLAVGFGISTPQHVNKVIAAGADGAIVGSAFINVIEKRQNDIATLIKELEIAASQLKKATKRL